MNTPTMSTPTMRHRTLGRSGLRVSELCLGTMMFGDQTDATEAGRITAHALDHGVNFIDTADQYANGQSEHIVGRLIKPNRSSWVLASKAGNPMGPAPINQGQSRRHVMAACEASLRRLGTDTIDLYYVHLHDPHTPWEAVVETYGALITQGKIREWAISNVRAWHIADIAHLCDQVGVPRPVALQPYYNLMNRQPETEVLPAARHFGLGVVSYSPIARGVLSGKYQLNATPEAGSRAARKDKRMLESEWRPESLEIAAKLKIHADNRGVSLVCWATAWVLNNRAITSVIAGPRTFEQWTVYPGALNYAWTAEDEAMANSFTTAGHPSTPGYTDPRYPVEGRFSAV
jgi:aryl-alcohol dehydrogenase-like predicted oxidoreductase